MDPGAHVRGFARVLAITSVMSACHGSRDTKPTRATSSNQSVDTVGAGTAATSTTTQPWDDAIGALVAVPAQDGGSALMFGRDSLPDAGTSVELFTHDDRKLTAIVHPGASPACSWRRATLATGAPAAPTGQWTLALSPGTVRPFALEAIADLPPRDSTDVAIRVSRLVSALADDSASAAFHGLPVVVRDAWRAILPDNSTVMIAIATRSLNMESNPRLEVVTIVAEPESAAPDASWRTAFTRRDTGPEDRVEGTDLLAGLLLAGSTPVLALFRETERGPVVDFIERAAPMTWRLRWTTASATCDR